MPVKISLAAPFQRFTGGKETVFYRAGALSEIISGLDKSYRGLKGAIMDKDGLKGHIVVLVNDRDVGLLQGLDTLINDGDEVIILPVVAGG